MPYFIGFDSDFNRNNFNKYIMKKNWKTTVLGILGAAVILATAKGWIDRDLAVFIGATATALFGIVATDSSKSE